MEIKLDLHIHSERSPDGRMPLSEIIDRAKAAGLQGAAVCDHDRVLEDVPDFPDFLLIPGVEISTEYGHLLGLFVTGPVETREFRQAVEAIHKQGGLAVLAHPFEHSADPGRIEPIVGMLDGVEVWNARANRKVPNANTLAKDFAKAHNLQPFGGSDAHVPQEVGNGVTRLEAESLSLAAVKAALLEGKTSVSGRNSPARYTAMSQLTKRRKTRAGLSAYGKWALFALKCLVQDVSSGGK